MEEAKRVLVFIQEWQKKNIYKREFLQEFNKMFRKDLKEFCVNNNIDFKKYLA